VQRLPDGLQRLERRRELTDGRRKVEHIRAVRLARVEFNHLHRHAPLFLQRTGIMAARLRAQYREADKLGGAKIAGEYNARPRAWVGDMPMSSRKSASYGSPHIRTLVSGGITFCRSASLGIVSGKHARHIR
jgi:hypothetical protein